MNINKHSCSVGVSVTTMKMKNGRDARNPIVCSKHTCEKNWSPVKPQSMAVSFHRWSISVSIYSMGFSSENLQNVRKLLAKIPRWWCTVLQTEPNRHVHRNISKMSLISNMILQSHSAESLHEEIRDLATSVGTGNCPQPIYRVTV